MTTNPLTELLRTSSTDISVEQLSEATYRVIVPSMRNVHDSVAFGLTREGGAWTVTDGGQLRYLLDSDYLRVVEVMECAGAVFTTRGGSVEFDIEHESSLASVVLAFGHYLAAAPTVWHALECARPAGSQKVSPMDLMAEETKIRLVEHIGPRAEHLVHLKYIVSDRDESVPAPLAIAAKGKRRRPPLVASFIDTQVHKQSMAFAKRNASFFFQVIRDWEDTSKYVVVRGDDDAVEHFANLFDRDNINTVSVLDLSRLYEDAHEAIESLMTL